LNHEPHEPHEQITPKAGGSLKGYGRFAAIPFVRFVWFVV
jgi:hypothetical protein